MNEREIEELVERADSAWLPEGQRPATSRADCADDRYDGEVDRQGDVIYIMDAAGVRQKYSLSEYSTEENIRGAHAALLRRQNKCNCGDLPGGACGY